jgi:DHA2 family multidrug resistance protein
MAVYTMGVIVAPILGPTLGGWITDSYSWRWIFYINLPIGLLAVLMVQTFVEDPPYIARRRSRRIDFVGFGLMAIWLATLQYILDKGQEADWFGSEPIRWLTAISAVAMIGFIVRELRTTDPIVDLRVLGDRNFALGSILVTMMGIVLYGTTAMLPLFLQTLLGYPALDSGLAVSPRGLGALIASSTVGRLVGFIDSRIMIIAGFGLLVVSGWMFSHLNLQIAMSNVVWANVVNGLATPLVFIPLTTTAMSTLSTERINSATGIYNLMRNIGGGIGIAAMTTFLTRGAQAHQATLVTHLTPYDPTYQQWLGAAQAGLQPQVGPSDAAAKALGLVYRELIRQATLLSYVDNFRLISVMGLLCIPLVLLFRKARPRAAVAAH